MMVTAYGADLGVIVSGDCDRLTVAVAVAVAIDVLAQAAAGFRELRAPPVSHGCCVAGLSRTSYRHSQMLTGRATLHVRDG